ncbi:hypothetical protein [Embleya sp. MST-111070]|uniref:hypothetical protein n=1 Tax=Embleya sp. MST-111070 TaxID=3398231 RepID=UPI003F73A84A
MSASTGQGVLRMSSCHDISCGGKPPRPRTPPESTAPESTGPESTASACCARSASNAVAAREAYGVTAIV